MVSIRDPWEGTFSHVLSAIVFLLYEEPLEGFQVKPGSPEFGAEKDARRSWKHLDFAKQHDLKLVGANYFVIEPH